MLATHIKKTARALGIEISRARTTRNSIAEHCALLRRLGFEPGTIIDVGAADGTPGLYDCFPDAHLLLIDPLEEHVSALQRISRRHAKARYTVAAAGARAGEIAINVDPGRLTGSSCLLDPLGVGSPRQVRMITLDQECADGALPGPYLLKIDTQGFELEVLRGSAGVLAQTEVVILEVSFFRFYTTNPIFSDLILFLVERGFELYDFLGSSTRPLDGALAQADVVFARRDGPLRREERFQ
jgi:FkbM family methyltransferase